MKNKEILTKLTALFSKQDEPTEEITVAELAEQVKVIGETILSIQTKLSEETVEDTTEETVEDTTEETVEEPTAVVEETEAVVEETPSELEIAMTKIAELEEKLTELSKQPVNEPVINEGAETEPATFAQIMMKRMEAKRKELSK